MSDTTTETTDAPTDTDPDANPERDVEPAQAHDTDWKAEARKWEQRAKSNKDAAERLAELEEAQKTDEQRQQERLTELEKTAKSSTLEAARLRVALRKGLTETQAKRLVGESEDDLEQDADELLATFAPADDDGRQVSRRPQERLRPGAAPDAEPEASPEDLADAVLKRQRGY